jgi:hypothetical protein
MVLATFTIFHPGLGELILQAGLVLERVGLEILQGQRLVRDDVVGEFDDLDVKAALGRHLHHVGDVGMGAGRDSNAKRLGACGAGQHGGGCNNRHQDMHEALRGSDQSGLPLAPIICGFNCPHDKMTKPSRSLRRGAKTFDARRRRDAFVLFQRGPTATATGGWWHADSIRISIKDSSPGRERRRILHYVS